MSHSAAVATFDQPLLLQDVQKLESMKGREDWFLRVADSRGEAHYYNKEEIGTSLREDILSGRFLRTEAVTLHAKGEDGAWNEAQTTLLDFSNNQFALRTLYEPVWASAVAGLKWGAIVGVGLKLLDTFILFSSVNPTLGFLFAAAVGVCFIPRIGTFGMVMIGVAMARFTNVNVFFAGLGAGIVGALLGCLPGMAIGGIVGLIRRASLPQAPDAEPERPELLFTAVILPLIGGAALMTFYIYVFNPWLAGLLE